MLRVSALALLLLAACGCESTTAPPPGPIVWQDWTPDLFARAQRERRLVLLHLGAGWCHWCHVMERETYGDPAVQALVARAWLPVHADQDARPDLAARYGDWGWPATILFDSQGRELAKLRGYIEAGRMLALLAAFEADPTPGPSASEGPPALRAAPAGPLDAARRATLQARLRDRYDSEHGAWGTVHKYLDADAVEWCLLRAREGDAEAAHMARETLEAERRLLDPVWGGAYQYSHGGTWSNPHFEKIMDRQAGDLRTYALAWAQWGEDAHLRAAGDVQRYLRDFLRAPEGAFFASQDADVVKGEHAAEYFALDDRGRRARGIPAIDRSLYARDNGLAIEALALLHATTGDAEALAMARGAAQWVLEHRALAGGGFAHGERDQGGPFLADTLTMGRACLALYAATAERSWLAHATRAADFLARFRGPIGYLPAPAGGAIAPQPDWEQNVALARFANLLARYTGKAEHRAMAEHAFATVAAPELADRRLVPAGLLLADRELGSEPVHVTVVGGKSDAAAQALFAAARALPFAYQRIEWLDPAEGPLPNPDVEYPAFPRAVAFVCANGTCSAPLEDVLALQRAAGG